MAYKVIYIDDEVFERGRFAHKVQELLNESGGLEVELIEPPENFANLTNSADMLLIDHDLSTASIDGKPIDYFGSTLAAEVRMRNPACPIVMVTKPEVITGNVQRLMNSTDVDLIVYKDDIYQDADKVRNQIVDLITGFKGLDAIQGQDWKAVLKLIQAEEDEVDLLKETGLPVVKGVWNVPQTANWLRNVVLRYPGILYDDLTAATRLGISLESFRSERVQEIVEASRYKGIFGDYRERWWRGRLFSIAQILISSEKLTGSISEQFAKAYHMKYPDTLDPAMCLVDGSPIADWVCYILNMPVKQQNSIPYYPDARPAIMDQARVSFKAIKESPNFDEDHVDPDGLRIVNDLWESQK